MFDRHRHITYYATQLQPTLQPVRSSVLHLTYGGVMGWITNNVRGQERRDLGIQKGGHQRGVMMDRKKDLKLLLYPLTSSPR